MRPVYSTAWVGGRCFTYFPAAVNRRLIEYSNRKINKSPKFLCVQRQRLCGVQQRGHGFRGFNRGEAGTMRLLFVIVLVITSAARVNAQIPASALQDAPGASAGEKNLKPGEEASHEVSAATAENFCIQGHGESDLWDEKSRQLYISRDKLQEDIHWKSGVNCVDCHGGNYRAQDINQAHAKEDGFRSKPEEVKRYCAICHDAEALELVKGVHAKAGEKNERGQGTLLSCDKCHGNDPHQILAVKDYRSPVFIDNQVKNCGSCHQKDYESYTKNVHGQGLYKMGLQVTAACADCHGSHGIYKPADTRSSLHSANVAATCGKCHRFIAERLQASIHGTGKGAGEPAERLAPGGKTKQHPSCTPCHQGHNVDFPELGPFRQQLPHLCGNCHGQLSGRYAMSIHGGWSG